MGKDIYRFEYDPVSALHNCPKLLGMELVQRGKQLEGGYYLNGDLHPFRRDKLKAYIYNGSVWIQEEGGRTVSLTQWLIEFGGAADYKEALKMIKGQSQLMNWNREVRQKAVVQMKHVPKDAVIGAAAYDLNKCSLFRWICTMFSEERVREVWKEYNVTTDSHGNCVYWYQDQAGNFLFDKRILYREDGHRDKTFFPGRQYRVGDGYTGRCYFGANLPDDGKKVFIVESEKSAILGRLYYGRRFMATGGKGGLRDIEPNMLLVPDMDARREWEEKGEVYPWWEKWPKDVEIGNHADIGDLVELKMKERRR